MYRPRHALLAEAVASVLRRGERVVLYECSARALQAAGGEPAEVAGHWAAAGRPREEVAPRVAAAEAAERVFGYAEAAAHWQRAIELCQTVPGTAGIGVPGLYVRAIDALEISGASERASALAEDAYRRFADHPDPGTAAIIHQRAAYYRGFDAPADGIPLIREALRLFGQAGPSALYAEAWLYRARVIMFHGEGQREESSPTTPPPSSACLDATNPANGTHAVSGDEKALLRLLAAGLTDEAAARRLGISVRTARRQVAVLMNKLGASSRFQAGHRAAQRGWLSQSRKEAI